MALFVVHIIAQTVIRLRATAAFRVSPNQQRRAAALQRGPFFFYFFCGKRGSRNRTMQTLSATGVILMFHYDFDDITPWFLPHTAAERFSI